MARTVRAQGWWQDLRDSLWVLPLLLSAVLLAVARLAVELEPVPGWVEPWVYGGTPQDATAVLGELASASSTVVGLVFSLTVIALQMASSQFTPRLMRAFMSDRGVQSVLGGMAATGIYHVAVLRTVTADGGDPHAFVPRLAVSLALVLALAATALLVYFISHVTQELRVEVVASDIVSTTGAQITAIDTDPDVPADTEAEEPPEHAGVVRADVSG